MRLAHAALRSVAWQLQKKKPKGLKTLSRAQKRTLAPVVQ
jgi:hypothetical protein